MDRMDMTELIANQLNSCSSKSFKNRPNPTIGIIPKSFLIPLVKITEIEPFGDHSDRATPPITEIEPLTGFI